MVIKEKKRSEINDKYKWDLSLLYTDNKWEEDFNNLGDLESKYKSYENKLNTALNIYDFLEFDEKTSIKLDALMMYASLRFDEDLNNGLYQKMKGKIEKLYSSLALASSFVTPELMELDVSDFTKFKEEVPELSKYDYYFDCLFRMKKHILPKGEEKILSSLSRSLGTISDTVSYLINTDLKFDNIKDSSGNLVELTNNNYSIYISDKDRNVRKQAFYSLYKGYEGVSNTLASNYSGKVMAANATAKLRGFASARDASLLNNFIDPLVYDNLINTVSDNLSIMDDYYNLKKEVMGLDELHIYDIYTPLLVNDETNYSFEEARDIVLKALSVLGNDYVNNLKKAFDEKWIDVFPNKGKKGGAYSWGCFTSKPYVLLNFNGKFSDVSTLAHELGHSMHSYYSILNNSYTYHNYEIFVAEIASQVNEILLARYLIDNTSSKSVKLTILDSLMELFKGSIIRQTMFAEFEKLMHESEDNGEILTSEFISDGYYKLYKKYSGNNMICDPEIRYEWEKIPHFYYDFYVYQYSTGLAAACYIAKNILSGDKEFRDNYLKFLSLGGSMDAPLELKMAGIDVTSPKFISDALDMFRDTIKEFKEIYEK